MYNVNKKMYTVIFYKTLRGEELALSFINRLQDNVRGKTFRWLKRLEELGPDLHRPFADVVRGKIRELCISHGRLEVRLLYFFYEKYAVITTGFLKKTDKIPESEIQKAINYMNDFLIRIGGN